MRFLEAVSLAILLLLAALAIGCTPEPSAADWDAVGEAVWVYESERVIRQCTPDGCALIVLP